MQDVPKRCKPAHVCLVERKSPDPNSVQHTGTSGKRRGSVLRACPAGNILTLRCVGHKAIKDFLLLKNGRKQMTQWDVSVVWLNGVQSVDRTRLDPFLLAISGNWQQQKSSVYVMTVTADNVFNVTNWKGRKSSVMTIGIWRTRIGPAHVWIAKRERKSVVCGHVKTDNAERENPPANPSPPPSNTDRSLVVITGNPSAF